MNLRQAVNKSYYEATGKTNLIENSSKWQSLIVAADNSQQDWQNEPGTQWDSLYQMVNIGTLGTATTYDLDDSIRTISKQERNPLILRSSDGTREIPYTYVEPERLRIYGGGFNYRNSASVFTVIGRQIVFPAPFTTSSVGYGYTINVPAFIYVDTLSNPNQTIQVDDPMWLVYQMASRYAQSKISLNYKVTPLLASADKRMKAMKKNQSSQLTEIPTFNADNYLNPGSYGGSGLSGEAWY